MQLSNRAINIQESPIRKMKPLADQVKAKGIKVYHLNIGQPDIETPKEIIKAYKKYHEKVLAYGPSQGLDLYRHNLVNYYSNNNITIEVDDIVVTTAGSEAIIFSLLTVCNPGDEIIVPEPFYTNYNSFAEIAGVKIVPLITHVKDGYALPSNDKIEELINNRTKAILICNPNNPTGVVYPQEDLERIAKIAQEKNLFIISDEVYREFVYDDKKVISFLNIESVEDRVIMVDSISKRYSACGARVGCLISRNKEIMKSVLKFAQARLCPPTIDQLAANEAINIKSNYFEKIIKEYEKRRNIVFNALIKIPGVTCRKPQGAFYIMTKLPINNAEYFIKWLITDFSIDNKTVMVSAGSGFYTTPGAGQDEIRIAYILNEKDLKEAMDIFKKGLEKYIKINSHTLTSEEE